MIKLRRWDHMTDEFEYFRTRREYSAEERAWDGADESSEIQLCDDDGGGPLCTLRPGHPGDHIGGVGNGFYCARWPQ